MERIEQVIFGHVPTLCQARHERLTIQADLHQRVVNVQGGPDIMVPVVRHRIVRQLPRVERGTAGVVRACSRQRVTVRNGFGHDLEGDNATGARPVVDHDGPAPRVRQLRCDDARDDVGRTAGREWHDHSNRLARIRLRRCLGIRCRRKRESTRDGEHRQHAPHLHIPPRWPSRLRGAHWPSSRSP